MPEYSRSTTIHADPDELFEYLSKVENLPDYFSGVKEAHHRQGDHISVTAPAEVTGQEGDENGEVRGAAWFSIDADAHSLSWGSEGDSNYSGKLKVEPEGEGAASIVFSMTTEHDAPEQINAGIDETLANIERLVAEKPPLQA